MSIINYLSRLMRTIDINAVKANLRSVSTEIADYILPSYTQARRIFRDWSFLNENIKKLNSAILNNVKLKSKPHPKDTSLDVIGEGLIRIQALIPTIVSSVDTKLGRYVETSGISYSATNYLRMVEVVEFYCRYARIYLSAVYAAEMPAYGTRENVRNIPKTTPGEWDWLIKHYACFIHVINVLDKSPNDIKLLLEHVSDMVIDIKSTREVESVLSPAEIDPLNLNGMNFISSGIFAIRSKIADYQINRYNEVVAEAKQTEFRALALEQIIANGQADALTEKKLQDYEDILMKLKKETADMEKAYGI